MQAKVTFKIVKLCKLWLVIEISPWQIFLIEVLYLYIIAIYALFIRTSEKLSVLRGENEDLSDGKRGAEAPLI